VSPIVPASGARVNRGPARAAAAGVLRASILVGSVYDWILAALILWSPPALLSFFRLPAPADPFHFRFAALPLVALPFFYLLAWRDPDRYSGVIGAMIVARLTGFVYLALYGATRGEPAAYALFGIGDLAFAIAHALLARRAGYARRDLFPLFTSR